MVIKQKLGALTQKAQQCIMKLEEAHKNVASEIKKLDHNFSKVCADIDKSFEEMKRMMEDRRGDLTASAIKIHEDKLEILQNQLKMIEKEKVKVETEYKKFRFQGDMSDIANKMKELNVIAESVDSFMNPREKCSIHYDNKCSIMLKTIQNHGTVRSN